MIWSYDANGLLTDLAVDSKNNLIMCGYQGGIGVTDYSIQKISENGLVWQKTFNSLENMRDYPTSVDVDENDNVYIVGAAHDMFTKGITNILKYDMDGNLLWQFRYDIPSTR